MKILYFLAHPESIGGAMKVLMTQAFIMQSNGNQVKVVIPNNNNEHHICEYEELCEIYHLDYEAAYYPIATCIEQIDITECLNCYDKVRAIVTNYNPELIHTVQLNITVEYISRELGIPHLMNVYQISKGMFNIKWPNIFPRFHSCDSIYYCEQWKEGLGVESRCIRVAYENNKSAEKSPLKGQIRAICIATFAEHKNQLLILEMLRECIKKDIDIHISFVGEDTSIYGKKCHMYVKENRLDNYVDFVGRVVDVEKYLCESDLLIHASSCESYPGVLVEAIANKKLVLTTAIAGIPELFIDEKNSLLVDNCNTDSLLAKLERYCELIKDDRTDDLIETAYQMYLNNHTYASVYKSLLEYYKNILSQKSVNSFDDIKKVFSFVHDYGEKVKINRYSIESQRSLWYLYNINKVINEKGFRTATIWGAGFYGNIAFEWCQILGLTVINVIDKYKEGQINNVEIMRPEENAISTADIVFLAIENVNYCEENMRVIEQYGKTRNIDYFLLCNNPCIQLI